MMKVKKEDGREDYFSKVYDLKEELGKGTVQFVFFIQLEYCFAILDELKSSLA